MNRVFLDSSYAIALSVTTDAYHQQALSLSAKYERHGKLVTTTAVLLEIGNSLALYDIGKGLCNFWLRFLPIPILK